MEDFKDRTLVMVDVLEVKSNSRLILVHLASKMVGLFVGLNDLSGKDLRPVGRFDDKRPIFHNILAVNGFPASIPNCHYRHADIFEGLAVSGVMDRQIGKASLRPLDEKEVPNSVAGQLLFFCFSDKALPR